MPMVLRLHSWEGAYFDADKLKSMMDGAAEIGVEVFVLDDVGLEMNIQEIVSRQDWVIGG
nr:alpha-galactosidase [Cellulophaga sp. L1A9]